MINKKILFLIIAIFFSNKILLADIKILVLVDNEIITNYDLKNEINYLEILNLNLNQLDHNQKLEIAKSTLIKQIIKKKEIKKISSMEGANNFVDNYLKDLYSKLGLNSEQEFENILKKKTKFDFIIFVCAESQAENCPVIPYESKKLYWSIDDPSSLKGVKSVKLKKIDKIRGEIENKVRDFIANYKVL